MSAPRRRHESARRVLIARRRERLAAVDEERVALATDEQVMRYNAMAVSSHQLAIDYGFTDIDGSMPGAPPDPSGG